MIAWLLKYYIAGCCILGAVDVWHYVLGMPHFLSVIVAVLTVFLSVKKVQDDERRQDPP
jgi:hypothetical protein